MRDGTLPGVSEDDKRVVCHVDMDCFYAACERLREPALRGEPLVVGMGYEPGDSNGAVATASYEARAFGVESAQPISVALDALPRKIEAATDPEMDVDSAGFYRPVDLDYYNDVAADVKEILREAADTVREVSIDEAYLDVTEQVGWEDDPRAFGAQLKAEIRDTVGVTASIGIAPTMSAAKVASDHDKPDGLVVVEPDTVQSFLAPLDIEAVHGIGPVTARNLREMGIETAGDLAAAPPSRIRERFGERGREVQRFAGGVDDREVEPRGKPKSLSRESAFTEPTDDSEQTRDRIRLLASDVAERATRQGALYQTIGIKIVVPPFDVNTRAHSLSGPVENDDLVESVALDLFTEFTDTRVRKLGVSVSNLSFADEAQAKLTGFTDDGNTSRAGSRTDAMSRGQRSLTDF
jgi:DNA polymerase IV (DinB-like DNA polymerase)